MSEFGDSSLLGGLMEILADSAGALDEEWEALECAEELELAQAEQERFDKLQQRIARLELTVAALISVLELRHGLQPDELDLIAARLDLADGVEDGLIGPDRSAQAPKCAGCGRPISKKRSECVFCGHAIEPDPPPPPPRLVSCARCGRQIREAQSLISEFGVVCPGCYVD